MDERVFKERLARLEKIAKVLEQLPPEVRKEAFDLVAEYVTGEAAEKPAKKGKRSVAASDGDESQETFFGKHDHTKPADNVKLIAAYFYKEYGTAAFSLDDLRQAATNVGITIPARPDMTLAQAKENGKKLFARAGKGMFRPTVHGEASLKATYSVKKGTKTRPSPE